MDYTGPHLVVAYRQGLRIVGGPYPGEHERPSIKKDANLVAMQLLDRTQSLHVNPRCWRAEDWKTSHPCLYQLSSSAPSFLSCSLHPQCRPPRSFCYGSSGKLAEHQTT